MSHSFMSRLNRGFVGKILGCCQFKRKYWTEPFKKEKNKAKSRISLAKFCGYFFSRTLSKTWQHQSLLVSLLFCWNFRFRERGSYWLSLSQVSVPLDNSVVASGWDHFVHTWSFGDWIVTHFCAHCSLTFT